MVLQEFVTDLAIIYCKEFVQCESYEMFVFNLFHHITTYFSYTPVTLMAQGIDAHMWFKDHLTPGRQSP